MHDFNRKVEDAFRKVEEHLNEAVPGINQKVADVTQKAEKEAKEIITYLNDEVVPQIRAHSTGALRIASEKLSQLADFLERQKRS